MVERKYPHLPGSFCFVWLEIFPYIICKMLENIYVQFTLDIFIQSLHVHRKMHWKGKHMRHMSLLSSWHLSPNLFLLTVGLEAGIGWTLHRFLTSQHKFPKGDCTWSPSSPVTPAADLLTSILTWSLKQKVVPTRSLQCPQNLRTLASGFAERPSGTWNQT